MTSAGALTLTRNPASGFLSGTTLGSLADGYTYDPTYGELDGYTANDGSTELYSVDFTIRDELGRIEQRVETIGGVTTTYDYTYDLAGRLTDVHADGLLQAHYDYDANSNRTGWTDPWGSGTATYDDQDRLTSYAGTTYTYTDNGELATKTSGAQTITYDYDVQGNLRQVVLPDGLTIDYVVDAANRRIGKKVDGVLGKGFLYQDQLNPVAELDGTGAVISTFVYASKPNVPDSMVKGGTTYRVISDHLGSVRLVVDTTDGTIAQRLDYDAFGRVMLDTNPGFQPFGFAGGLYDPQTGLVRFGARDYDPETGRWTSKDPIGFGGGDTNLYGNVVRDPVNLLDPFGRDWIEATASISAGIGDALLLGFGDELRSWADRTFGWNRSGVVNRCSGGYRAASILPGMPLSRISDDAALLIIDVQDGFDDPCWGVRNNPDAERRIAELLAIWRRSGRPVIHVQHLSREPESPLRPGQPGVEIKATVAPRAGEKLVQKRVNSAFIGTDLEEHLRREGIGTLVVTGLTTDHCVSTTTRMAGNLGFETHLVADATATFGKRGPDGTEYDAELIHDTALASLHGEFAEVLGFEELVARL